MTKRIFIILFILFVTVYSQIFRGATVRKSTLGVYTAGEEGVTDSIGAEWWATAGSPIGGWWGYSDTVISGDDTVYNSTELVTAIGNAGAGDVIYLMDTCTFNMDGKAQYGITIDGGDGIVIASGRGRVWGDTVSNGALVYFSHDINEGYRAFFIQKNVRITGIRFRGPISELEGEVSTSDTMSGYATSSNQIGIMIDNAGPNNPSDVEIDNCEFWGWGYVAIYPQYGYNHIHNNYFHDGNRLYYSYGMVVTDTAVVKLEANYFDNFDIMPSGATSCRAAIDTICYNIFAERMEPRDATIYMHGDLQSPVYIATANIYNNTAQRADYGDRGTRTFYHVWSTPPTSKDSTFIHHNWIWDSCQTEAIGMHSKSRAYTNSYTSTSPDGVSSRRPTAVIWSSVDSCTVGTAAATVKFHHSTSSDPDGSLIQYYWHFGDSMDTDNWTRLSARNVANHTDTVSHTFHSIGKYMVRLTVVDNYGLRDDAFKTINVKPADDSLWLSFWSKDNNAKTWEGIWERQCLIINDAGDDSTEVWSQDVAGDGSWEHIVENVTDVIGEDDSVTIRFKIVCIKDTALGSPRQETYAVFDDIVLYGGSVVNGNIETGYPDFRNWYSPSSHARSDTHWVSSKKKTTGGGHFGCYESSSYAHGGVENLCFYCNASQSDITDYCEFHQKVDILGQ